MQITKGKGGIFINYDKNVTSYATDDYMHADMSGYSIEAPTASELRSLYNAAQRIYWNMKAERQPVEACAAARTTASNKYMRYKNELLAAYEKRS